MPIDGLRFCQIVVLMTDMNPLSASSRVLLRDDRVRRCTTTVCVPILICRPAKLGMLTNELYARPPASVRSPLPSASSCLHSRSLHNFVGFAADATQYRQYRQKKTRGGRGRKEEGGESQRRDGRTDHRRGEDCEHPTDVSSWQRRLLGRLDVDVHGCYSQVPVQCKFIGGEH